MNTTWISSEYYEEIVYLEKLQNIMKIIEKENIKCERENLILVHPTEKTLSIMNLGKSNPILQSLCNTLSSGIDVKYMYSSALYREMFPSGITDQNTLNLYTYLIDLFCSSGILLQLQRFFRDAIEVGETLAWFPVKYNNKDSRCNIPQISKHYVIAYMVPQEKWIAKDIDGEDIDLYFLNYPDTQFIPCSTVRDMITSCEQIEKLRKYFFQSIHFSSRPSYILSKSTPKNTTDKKDNGLLTDKFANVAGVNRHLENMIKENMISSTHESQQKRTTLSCKLQNYVSSVGSSNIDNYNERKKLQRQVQNLQDEIEELKDNNFPSKPLQCYAPDDMDVAGSYLSVHPLDMLSYENKHERDWINASVGTMNNLDRHVRKERNAYPQMTSNKLLKRKQFLYQQIIVYELLGKWLHENKLNLDPTTDIDCENISLSDFKNLKELMNQEHFMFLISKYTGLPIEMITYSDKI